MVRGKVLKNKDLFTAETPRTRRSLGPASFYELLENWKFGGMCACFHSWGMAALSHGLEIG